MELMLGRKVDSSGRISVYMKIPVASYRILTTLAYNANLPKTQIFIDWLEKFKKITPIKRAKR